jgi:hypothetical protein
MRYDMQLPGLAKTSLVPSKKYDPEHAPRFPELPTAMKVAQQRRETLISSLKGGVKRRQKGSIA